MKFPWFWQRKHEKPTPEVSVSAPLPRRAEVEFMPPAPPAAPPPVFTGAAIAAAHERLNALVSERSAHILATLPRHADHGAVERLLDQAQHSEEATIRPIPTAAKRAMALARNPQSNLNEVAEAFERDPSLAEGLLRLANSAWYRGGDDQVDSLRQALQRTGSSGAEIVIMENALKSTLCRPGGAYDAMVAQVWTHLSRTAPLARTLADTFRVEPEAGYMLALLHDAGKLVLFDALSELRHRSREGARIAYPTLRLILAELHEPLGGLAMLRWGLELDRAAAVAGHHRRERPLAADAGAELLFVAERTDLALASGTPCDVERWIAEGGLQMGPETLRRALSGATDGALRFCESDPREDRAAA